jgi:magnesium-transporting ATPase (P-type)
VLSAIFGELRDAIAIFVIIGLVVARSPFDPVRKRESTAWSENGGVRVCVKGAPESVLGVCQVHTRAATRRGHASHRARAGWAAGDSRSPSTQIHAD